MFTTSNQHSRRDFTTALVAACFMVTGTADAQEATQNLNTYEWVVTESEINAKQANVSTQDMVQLVLSNFGLAVKDFESIFEVKRAAIYNWKKGSNEPNPAQFTRIKNLYDIALQLTEFSGRIGRISKTHLHDGMSLVERLAQDVIDVDTVIEHHKVLVKKIEAQHAILEKHSIENISIAEEVVVLPEGHA